MKIVVASTVPIIQANFFCGAPTYSGTWFLTIQRPITNEGENLGLIKTRIKISVRNIVTAYLSRKKSPWKITLSTETNISTNNIPAAALISRSFKTGILYPSTVSPKFINLFIVSPFPFLKILIHPYLYIRVTHQLKDKIINCRFTRIIGKASNLRISRYAGIGKNVPDIFRCFGCTIGIQKINVRNMNNYAVRLFGGYI